MTTSSIPRTSGIYVIANTKNGKVYIGKGVNVRARWLNHKSALRNGHHHNTHLQHAWDKYGEKVFKVFMLEHCPVDKLDEREIHHISVYKTNGLAYNITDGGGGTLGHITTPETRKKMSEIALNRSPPSEETRRRISEANTGKVSPRRGVSLSDETRSRLSEAQKHRLPASEETRKKISEANKGKPFSQEHCDNISKSKKGQTPHNKGKSMSDEQKRKISESMRGKPSPKRGIPLSEEQRQKLIEANKKSYIVTNPEGIEIEVTGLTQFCRENNLSVLCMFQIANGRQKRHQGWICRKIEVSS